MTKDIYKSRHIIIVTGSTTWSDSVMINNLLDQQKSSVDKPIHLLTGTADGADAIARNWALQHQVSCSVEDIGTRPHPQAVQAYNEKMLSWGPDIILAFKENFDPSWQLETCNRGTEHMCRIAAKSGVPILLNSLSALQLTA